MSEIAQQEPTPCPFYLACLYKQLEVAQELITHKPELCKPDYIDDKARTSLQIVLYNKWEYIAERMLHQFGTKCLLDKLTSDGTTLLIAACANQLEKVALKLINDFTDTCRVDYVDREGDTALLSACCRNLPTVAHALLTKFGALQCNAGQKSVYDNTALLGAVIYNMIDVVKLFIEEHNLNASITGELPDWHVGYYSNCDSTPLWTACNNKHPEIALMLLDAYGLKCNILYLHSGILYGDFGKMLYRKSNAFNCACANKQTEVYLKMIEIICTQAPQLLPDLYNNKNAL